MRLVDNTLISNDGAITLQQFLTYLLDNGLISVLSTVSGRPGKKTVTTGKPTIQFELFIMMDMVRRILNSKAI